MVFCFAAGSVYAEIDVTTDFEGGSVDVISIKSEENLLRVKPDRGKRRDEKRIWFYFKVNGYDSTRLLRLQIEFAFEDLLNDYIVYSYGQKNWLQLKGKDIGKAREFEIRLNGSDVYFALGYPYTYSDLIAFINRVSSSSNCCISTLTVSEDGLWVPLLKVTDDNNLSGTKPMIWFIVRQHAFESPTSFFVEGIMEQLLSPDDDAVSNFRNRFDTYIVPMMDVDSVKEGNTGKGEAPYDFNRNWPGQSHWNAVKAVKQLISIKSVDQPLKAFIDCHSPYPISRVGSHYYNHYETGSPKHGKLTALYDIYRRRTGLDIGAVNRSMNGLSARDYIDNNDAEDAANYHPQIDFATTNEQSWHALPERVAYTPEQLRNFGRKYAQSIIEFYADNWTINAYPLELNRSQKQDESE